MIEVHIAKDRLDVREHDTLVGMRIIKSLREAGIPVIGTTFSMRGIERGSLTYTNGDDIDGDTHVYTFKEDEKDVKVGKPLRANLKNGAIVYKTGRHAVVVDEDDEL